MVSSINLFIKWEEMCLPTPDSEIYHSSLVALSLCSGSDSPWSDHTRSITSTTFVPAEQRSNKFRARAQVHRLSLNLNNQINTVDHTQAHTSTHQEVRVYSRWHIMRSTWPTRCKKVYWHHKCLPSWERWESSRRVTASWVHCEFQRERTTNGIHCSNRVGTRACIRMN